MDVLIAHGLESEAQNQRFARLCMHLTQEEAMVVQSLSLSSPRPSNIYDKAKSLLISQFQKPFVQHFGEAITRHQQVHGLSTMLKGSWH